MNKEPKTVHATDAGGLSEKVTIKVENIEDGTSTVLEPEVDGKSKKENSTETVYEDDAKVSDSVNKSPVNIKENHEIKGVTEIGQIPGCLEIKADDERNLHKDNADIEDKEVSDINEEEDISDANEFIEFEFSPIKKEPSVHRESSASPDAEAVIDQLYEAAQKENRGELCNLMFNTEDDKEGMESSAVKSGEKMIVEKQRINQNKAIINLLKRKTPIEKEHIVSEIDMKKRKVDQGNVDFTNVKNIHNIGSLPLGNLTSFVVPCENQKPPTKRKKNPYRTPTPPNLNPSGDPIYDQWNFKNSCQDSSKSKKQNSDRNLIDYSVLTKALTKTLESKIQEGEGNDVKIVIFCNNKPIQSFSVRNNGKKAEEKAVPKFLPPSMLPPASSNLSKIPSQKLFKTQEDTVNINEIMMQNRTFLSKHINQNLELSSNNIPTIADVKAILERNKQIAEESLAKFITKTRSKTKRIPDEKVDDLIKEFRIKGNNIESKTSPELSDNQNSDLKDDKIEEDMAESNLVINDSVTTDENCNESFTEVKCDQCPKVFKHQRYLNRHKIRVHSTSKLATQQKEQKERKQDESHDLGINKTIAALLLSSDEKKLKNVIGTTEGEKLDGTAEVESVIKTEPLSDSEDQEIQKLLADENVIKNLIKASDDSKISSSTESKQPQRILAKDLLSPSYKSKAFSFQSGPPVTGDGLIEPVYVCEQCGKFYRARKTLKDHFLREHAKDKDDEPLYLYITGNKYQCPICFNNYHSGSELVSHTKKHTGELRSVCKLCGKVYSSVHVLRRHIDNVHADVKPRPFKCELCDYAASNKWHLKEHYRRHTGEQPYKCPVCEKSFSHQGTMNRHCKTIHGLEIPSQRPFIRNNISELPDLPYDDQLPETFPKNEAVNLMCSESEMATTSSDSEKETDLDLSIVKSEPIEVEVD